MDKRKRDEVPGHSTATPAGQPGLLGPLEVSAKKPRLVSPSAGAESPVASASSSGPKRVILKIRQPPPAPPAAAPVPATVISPPAVTTAVPNDRAPEPTPESKQEPSELTAQERKWKEAVQMAMAAAKPGENAVVNDARLFETTDKFLGMSPYLCCPLVVSQSAVADLSWADRTCELYWSPSNSPTPLRPRVTLPLPPSILYNRRPLRDPRSPDPIDPSFILNEPGCQGPSRLGDSGIH